MGSTSREGAQQTLRVPEAAFDLLRERIPRLEVATVEALQGIASYQTVTHTALHASVIANMESLIYAVRTADPSPDATYLSELTQRTRDRFDAGVRSEDIIRGYRTAMLLIQQTFAEVCEGLGVGTDQLYAIFQIMLLQSDEMITHVSVQFQRYMVEKQVADANRALVFVEELLAGSVESAQLVAACREYGLDAQERFRVFIAWHDARALGRVQSPTTIAETLMERTGAGGIAVARHGLCVGLTPSTVPAIDGVAMAVGPRLVLESAPRSFELAERTRSWMAEEGRKGVVDFDQPGWKLLIATEPELTNAYVESIVRPVRRLGWTGETLLDTVAAYIRSGRRIKGTAAGLFVHENTLRHRLKRFHDTVGEDVNASESLLRITWALTAEGYLD